ncbi:MAG TPA: family 43 glycosylhydrolase, partial [Acidimicrobiales bacterium]|nr:family 43 glycosylhydrolase [Acidimicrobiales bacterium]
MIRPRRALAALGLGVGVAVSAPLSAASALDLVALLGPPPATTPVYDHDAPDPDVIRVTSGGGATTYYAYTTNSGGDNVPVLSSSDLRSWVPAGDALPHLPAWQSPGFVWGPGVAQFGATYVMYYSSLVTADGLLCISEATASSPTGPFTDTRAGPLVCQPDLGGSIDPSPFIDNDGHAYLYWKSNAGGAAIAAQIWEAPLSADGTALVGAPTAVLNQDQSWEATVEGPDMVHTEGEYVLFYSGGLWNGAGYGVGYALCSGPAGPCGKPGVGPVLHSDQLRLGPGGESFFTDTNGDLFMAYAAWDGPWNSFSYGSGAYRSLWIASVTFDPAPVIHADEQPEGYVLAAADGGAFTFGSVRFHGSMGGHPLAAPVVGSAAMADGGGYWMVAADGGVFSFGDAGFSGSMGGRPLAAPVVGMAPTPDGGGYWLVAADGGVFAFGDAGFQGSMGGRPLAAPVVGMAPTPDGGGYWLVAADGGVFAFGDAKYFGSEGGTVLAKP